MADMSPEPILQVASGFMAFKHLAVSSEVGVFSGLADGPLTLDALAERTGLPRRTLRIVADAMVALGFLERQGDTYQNGPVAATFLSGHTPADLRPFLRFWNALSYPLWLHFETAIRGGAVPPQELSEAQQQIFSAGVEALTAGVAQTLAMSYDFARHQRLLDVGGGTGSFLLAILRRHPHLRGTLFELPGVAVIARQRLEGDPVTARVEIVEGDALQDEIPAGHDAVLLANFVHLFAPERIQDVLQRIREQVPAGARLLLVDFWTNPTHTQPVAAALLAGEFLLVSGAGDVYSVEEMQRWLEATRWQLRDHQPLAGPQSLLVAEAM